jgi:CheY-like chemotaxis protein
MDVLVADPEPVWQEFICARLRSCGFQPISVVNGERAWAILQEKNAPRLVIADRQLPGMSGIELCRHLRARRDAFYTFMLLLIRNPYRTEEILGIEAGADDCISKPFNQEELFARVGVAERVLDIDTRLSKVNSRWRTLVDNLPFGVATVDSKGILKRMNTTFAHQMGYASIHELLGQPLSWHVQRKVDVNGILEEIRWAEPFNDVSVCCCGAKGKRRTLRLWGRPLPPNDEAVYEIVAQE